MNDCGESEAFLPLQQGAVYGAAFVANGARARWLEAGDKTVLAIERSRLRLISRAVFGASHMAENRRVLRKLARWPGITIATPETGIAGTGIVPLVTPMHHAIWALGPDIRTGMAGNWRGSLVKAERLDLELVRGGEASLDALLRAEAVQRVERQYRALPEAFARALPGHALRLWEWRQRGDLQAAMCFVVHGSSATYHLGWGSDRARSNGAHALMLTRAAEALWAEGVRWLDLGAVDSERAPGLARFKLGTGAELRRLGPTCLVLP